MEEQHEGWAVQVHRAVQEKVGSVVRAAVLWACADLFERGVDFSPSGNARALHAALSTMRLVRCKALLTQLYQKVYCDERVSEIRVLLRPEGSTEVVLTVSQENEREFEIKSRASLDLIRICHAWGVNWRITDEFLLESYSDVSMEVLAIGPDMERPKRAAPVLRAVEPEPEDE